MWPCFMGIDIASRNELIAAGHTEEEVGQLVGADTLRYLSIAGLRRSMGDPAGRGFCFACFTGDYPVRVPQQLEMDKMAMERVDAPAEPSRALAQLT
jgi:amidophosphoribosyltransferase